MLALVSRENAVCVVCARTGQALATLLRPHMGVSICALQWSLGDRHLVWAADYWNQGTGTVVPIVNCDQRADRGGFAPLHLMAVRLISF